MSEFKITKRYGRKIGGGFQSVTFETELTHTVEVNSAEELQAANDKLFNQAKALTDLDMEAASDVVNSITNAPRR